MTKTRGSLLFILMIALVLRLAAVLSQDHRLGYESGGGDATWYLVTGYALATGFDEGYLPGYGVDLYPDGYPVYLPSLPTPPLYLLFVGIPQALFPREAAVLLVRMLQVLLGVATCYFAYRLGRAIAGDERAGWVAAALLAISPALVLETAQIVTETLFIFLIMAALTVYVEKWRASPGGLALAGVLLGLATLTRAALLLFPLGLGIHLLLTCGLRRGAGRAALLLLVYGLVVGSWTVYNLARWDRWVIGGEGFAAFLYLGATESGWQGPDATDAALAEGGALPPETSDQQDVYLESAGTLISSNPTAYLSRRARQLALAYAQPHGTLLFGGASVRDLVTDWLREDRTLAGLGRMAGAPGFWPKLALYAFHYAGLVLGAAGIWLTRRRWRLTLPLAGFVLYISLMHLFLDVIPRYLFPAVAVLWLFAGAALVRLWQARRKDAVAAADARQPEPSP